MVRRQTILLATTLATTLAIAGSALAQADKPTVVNPGLNKARSGAAASQDAAAAGRRPVAGVPGLRAKGGGHDQEPPGQGPVKSRTVVRPGGAQMHDQGGKQDQGSVQGGTQRMQRRAGAQLAPHEQSGNQGQGVGQTGYRPIQQSARSRGGSTVGQPNPAAEAARSLKP